MEAPPPSPQLLLKSTVDIAGTIFDKGFCLIISVKCYLLIVSNCAGSSQITLAVLVLSLLMRATSPNPFPTPMIKIKQIIITFSMLVSLC